MNLLVLADDDDGVPRSRGQHMNQDTPVGRTQVMGVYGLARAWLVGRPAASRGPMYPPAAQTSAARLAIADDLPDVSQPTNRPAKIMAGWVTADMLGLG